MPIEFKVPDRRLSHGDVFLVYSPDDVEFIEEKLRTESRFIIRKTFRVTSDHLVDDVPKEEADVDELIDVREPDLTFRIGKVDKDYFKLSSDVLGTEFDVLISRDYKLRDKMFMAVRDIAIFPRIDSLIKEAIVIGGPRDGAIPTVVFDTLLAEFPNTGELNRYAAARITRILRDHLPTMTEAQVRLETYLKKRRREKVQPAEVTGLIPYEIHKFEFVRDRVAEMLAGEIGYSEIDWQRVMVEFILLIFPKYVAVVREVPIRDYLTDPDKPITRKCDFGLIDANGYLDLIEIKKPMTKYLLSTAVYRESYPPRYELSGTIMQVEKYILHLTKWGIQGEKHLNNMFGARLNGLMIKVTNPKGVIIAGRSNGLNAAQLADLEVIKRKYANMLDIITYDDLLARLDRIVENLKAFRAHGRPPGLDVTAAGGDTYPSAPILDT